MQWMRSVVMLAIAGAGCDGRVASARDRPPGDAEARPRLTLAPIPPASLCVTKGSLAGGRVVAPSFRAVAQGHAGDAAAISVIVRGATVEQRTLDSGQLRRQLGLKLRADNGCNLVYVIWRLDPTAKVEVSVKHNAGARTAEDCGTRGYAKVKPAFAAAPPPLQDGTAHELRAEIEGDELVAWIDDRMVWRGALPAAAAGLSGPAGIRSDNLELELAALAVDARAARVTETRCHPEAVSAD